jgi:hypothetical protein
LYYLIKQIIPHADHEIHPAFLIVIIIVANTILSFISAHERWSLF